MAFPINPVDQQTFTNPLGTAYKYDSTRTAWLIMSQAVVGPQGDTGIPGVTGILGIDGQTGIMGVDGVTGIQGVTGILGIDGQTGIQGLTGILGIDGQTGIQGLTGILGIDGQTGIQGLTGLQGPGGTGLTNYVTKFIDGTGGVIGSSIIYDSGSRIGIGTTSPGGILHISGVEYGGYFSGLLIDNDNDTTGSEVGIDFNVSSSDTTAGDVARVSAIRTGVGPTGDLIVSTSDNGSLIEKMRVTSSGKVGVGTINPIKTLHIKTSEAGTEVASIRIDNGGSPSNHAGIEFFASPTDASGSVRSGRIYAKFDGVSYSNAILGFQSMTNGNVLVDTLALKNGKAGIGTTNPISILHVKADTTNHSQIRIERTAFNKQSTVAFIPHVSASPENPQWNVGLLASDSSVTVSYYDGTGGSNILTIDRSGVSVGGLATPGYVMTDALGRLVGGTIAPTGIQGMTGLANFLDSTGYPELTLMPVLLYNSVDDTLFCGASSDSTNWIQISAGALQGGTGMQGLTGLALGATGIDGVTGMQGFTGIAPRTGTLTFSISTPIGSVATGIMGQTVLTSNTAFNTWYLLADASSAINVDVQKSTYTNYPATTSMHGTTGISLSGTIKNSGNAGSWSAGNTGAAGDVLRVILAGSDSTASKVSLSLGYTLF